MKEYFLDVNTCIGFLEGQNSVVRDKLQALDPTLIKIPAIVMGELWFGVRKTHLKRSSYDVIEKFLFPFEVVPFGRDAAVIYGRIGAAAIKNQQALDSNQLVLAATVLARRGTLVTPNVTIFKGIQHLKIESWG